MRLPISDRTSYLGVFAAYCSNFGHFAFLNPTFGGLGTMYDVHLGLIGSGLPIIIIINKVLIKVTLNKVIAGALYIVICG